MLFEVPLYVLSASKFGDPRSYADGSTAFVSTSYFSFVLQLPRSYAVCNRHRYYQNNNRTMLAACVRSLHSFYQNNSILPPQVGRTCLTRGWCRRWFAVILGSTNKPTRKRSRDIKMYFFCTFDKRYSILLYLPINCKATCWKAPAWCWCFLCRSDGKTGLWISV